MIVEDDVNDIKIQVKGMQRKASICWNISLSKLKELSIIYVLVNLNADTLERPEYFVLTEEEVVKYFKSVNSGWDYLDYNQAKRLQLQDTWEKIQ